jgi:hypothetical protein
MTGEQHAVDMACSSQTTRVPLPELFMPRLNYGTLLEKFVVE